MSSSSCVLYSVYTQYNDLNAFIVMYCSVLLCICLYCCVLLCIVVYCWRPSFLSFDTCDGAIERSRVGEEGGGC